MVDGSPDNFGIIEIPQAVVATDDDRADAQRIVSREFERAKQDRPDLAVRVTPTVPQFPDAALLLHVHEHEWIGGQCIRGCGQERQQD